MALNRIALVLPFKGVSGIDKATRSFFIRIWFALMRDTAVKAKEVALCQSFLKVGMLTKPIHSSTQVYK